MSKQNEKPVATATNTETLLIVNPSSSSGSTGKNWNDFYLQVKEFFGENPEIVFTTKSDDGTSLAREYLQKGFKNIVAIGGDGTINEVANGFFILNRVEGRAGGIKEDNSKKKLVKAVVTDGIYSKDDSANNNISIDTTASDVTQLPPQLKQINPDAVFSIISSGTRNVLAKSLDLPAGSFECCKHYAASKMQKKLIL
jgi:diacylglycerol kinase (ATP)